MTLGREQDDSQRWERYSREIGVLHIFSLYNFPMHLERGLHGGMGFAGIAARVGPSYHILTSSSCKPSDSQPLRQGRPPDQPGLAVSWRQHATASLPEPSLDEEVMGRFGGNLYIYQKKNMVSSISHCPILSRSNDWGILMHFEKLRDLARCWNIWVIHSSSIAASSLATRFLNYLMMGTPASPLYKALVDSGLGSRVIGGGLDDGMLQATFSVGLKDAWTADVG